jgi:DNA-binding GntR family transcriptional regulator
MEVSLSADFKLIAHESLGDRVYNSISLALMTGALRAGDRLRIRELAAKMGVSVTPVRDAILRLVQDDALILRSPRDIRVPDLSTEQYVAIRNVRIELEGMAAEEAALKATSKDIQHLKELIQRNERAIRDGDWARGTECNQQFHFAVVNIAQTDILLSILQRLWIRTGPLVAQVYGQGGLKMVKHHHPILAAIEARDPAAARAAVRDDILEGGEVVLGAKKGTRARKSTRAGRKATPVKRQRRAAARTNVKAYSPV